MAEDDWFRRENWSETDKQDFHSRLNRCRDSRSKAQFARIQASHIQESSSGSKVDNAKAAIELLEMVIGQWPAESELASANLQYAQCLLILNEHEAAVERFRRVFALQRQFKKFRTTAHLDFACLCISQPRPDLYDEAVMMLDEFKSILELPRDQFIDRGVRAVILESRGEQADARKLAGEALEAAAKTRSELPRHRTFGIVDPASHHALLARLKAICR